MYIKIYGSRGSIPFFSRSNVGFGGNTSCVRVDTNGRTIILDAGSGLFQYGQEMRGQSPDIDLLLGHLHLDHTIGLPMYAPLLNEDCKTRILTKNRGTGSLASQVFGSFKPPYWPLPVETISRAELVALIPGEPFMLADDIVLHTKDSPHFDNTTAFRIEGDKTLVYLVDFEMSTKVTKAFVEFCKGADIIIFDASYLPNDVSGRHGWGHSTYEAGMLLAEWTECPRMLFTHLNPEYTDEMIKSESAKLNSGVYSFAYDGLEMSI